MSDYAFFEYQAKLTSTGHAENEGELVHCRIRMNHSTIWNVTEEELYKLENVSDYHRVGDCEIYFHNADDRSSSPVSGGRELMA
jgi:hypothetical protein